MPPRILLVQPPIYDFSAYDFWLKPYGLLRVAGALRGRAELSLFDFLDRSAVTEQTLRAEDNGCGEFPAVEIPKPAVFAGIPRKYRRFGRSREEFREFLGRSQPFQTALVSTGMTYWYLGVKEVIADIRQFSPGTAIILGGNYATLCPAHAAGLGADSVVSGPAFPGLFRLLGIEPAPDGLPYWELYPSLNSAVVKLTDGCPFQCSYCAVPLQQTPFAVRPLKKVLAELQLLCKLGVANVAFYDDALLFEKNSALLPFLKAVTEQRLPVSFYTPNALHARLVDDEAAEHMLNARFKLLFLGFEVASDAWFKKTGGKAKCKELEQAVARLKRAGFPPGSLWAYIIFGHPGAKTEEVEYSMQYAHSLGLRIMLADFSPIPGTPDGECCREYVDINEPLTHNKTFFPITRLGFDEVNRVKNVCRELNGKLRHTAGI